MGVRKARLGRGLDALLAPVARDTGGAEELKSVPITMLVRGRYQPRTRMDQAALEELAASIRAQGVLQPLVVRRVESGEYEIVAGERRWRAAQIAGLKRVPAIVREIPDEAAMAVALIENIQRENLNPVEEAQGLKRLLEEFELTHQQAAEGIGRSRTAVTNLLRLLSLAPRVLGWLEEGALDMGHARALLTLPHPEQVTAAQTVISKGLSVREAEALSRRLARAHSGAASDPSPASPDRDVQALERELSERLGATVRVRARPSGAGQLVIAFHSLDELDGILDRIR